MWLCSSYVSVSSLNQISMNAHKILISVVLGTAVIMIMEHFMNVRVKMEQYSQE